MEQSQIMKEWIETKDVWAMCKFFFKIELTKMQENIVKEVAYNDHNRVIITCMTRYGKSYCVSMGVLLYILLNRDKKVIIVAPTLEKTTIIRNHIAYFVSQSHIFINLLDLDRRGHERIRKEVSKKRMTWKNGVEMRTLSAEGQGEALMGFGADLLIVDEECDIDFEVYRSKITRMLGDSPDTRFVGIGNPHHRDNQMWQQWTNPDWFKIHVDYKIALKEGRTSETFIEEQRGQLTDREFKVLYEAEFPEESEDQLIKYSWIELAQKRQLTLSKIIRRLGVDVARSGNDVTVLTYIETDGDNYLIKQIKDYSQADTMQTVGHILEFNNLIQFDEIVVDTSGLGAGVTDRLKELKRENKIKGKVIEYMGGMSPITDQAKDRYLNQKAEAYFHLRELFEKGKIFITKHPKLIDQLVKMKWEPTSNNKIRIRDPGEKEGDTAEQKSPDFSDSLCYSVWRGSKVPLSFILMKDPKTQLVSPVK